MDRDAEFLLFLAHERIRRAQRGAEFARLAAQTEAAPGARSARAWLRTGSGTVRVRTGRGLVRLGTWIAGIPATVPTSAANRPTPC
jgi:hypothetical protein